MFEKRLFDLFNSAIMSYSHTGLYVLIGGIRESESIFHTRPRDLYAWIPGKVVYKSVVRKGFISTL